jgi:hypothetical protein
MLIETKDIAWLIHNSVNQCRTLEWLDNIRWITQSRQSSITSVVKLTDVLTFCHRRPVVGKVGFPGWDEKSQTSIGGRKEPCSDGENPRHPPTNTTLVTACHKNSCFDEIPKLSHSCFDTSTSFQPRKPYCGTKFLLV